MVELEVPGFRPAMLALPRHRDRRRPVLIAAHGAGDSPTWQCRIWQEIVDGRGYVLCPTGTLMGWLDSEVPGYFYRDHHALEKEVLAAITALATRYQDTADVEKIVYTGYSQGATMGALMAVKHGALFPRLVLVEGGEREWDVPTSARFAAEGGQRVLFACGRSACSEPARRSLMWVRKGQVQGRVEVIDGAGHVYDGPVAGRLKRVFSWVVEGDERW